MINKSRIFLTVFTLAGLSACASMDLPKVGFEDDPAFAEEAQSVNQFPRASEAPATPDDLRTDRSWDIAAKRIIRERDLFSVPSGGEAGKSDAQIEQEIEQLKSRVHAYKLDDPQ